MVKTTGLVGSVIDKYLSGGLADVANDMVWSENDAPGEGALRILRCAIESEDNILTNETSFRLVYEFKVMEDGISLGVNPHIYNMQDLCIFNVGTAEKPLKKGRYRTEFSIPGGLMCQGIYRIDNLYFSYGQTYFMHKQAHSFEIVSVRKDEFSDYLGVVFPSNIRGNIVPL